MDFSGAPPITPAPDLDTMMQRIRDAVKQRSQSDVAPAIVKGDVDLFDQLDQFLRDQATANETVLESFAQMANELRELREHAAQLADALAQDSDRENAELRELRQEMEGTSGASEAISLELEDVAARVYQIEPRIDDQLAKAGASLRQTIAASTAELQEQARLESEAVEARISELGRNFGAAQKGAIEAALIKQAEAFRAQIAAAVGDASLKLAAAINAKVAELNRGQAAASKTIAAQKEESHNSAAKLEARLDELDASVASSGAGLDELRRVREETHGDLLARTAALERQLSDHLTQSGEQDAAAQARLAQLESATSHTAASVAAMDESAAQARADVQTQAAAVNERLNQLAAALAAEVGSLQSRIDGIVATDRREQLISSVRDLNARLEASEGALHARAIANEERVTAVQADAEQRETTAFARLTQLEEAVSELRSLTVSAGEITAAASSQLQAGTAAQQERLAGFESSVSGDLAALRQQLQAMNVDGLTTQFTATFHDVGARLDAAESLLREHAAVVAASQESLAEVPHELASTIGRLSEIEAAVVIQRAQLEEQINHALDTVRVRLGRLEHSTRSSADASLSEPARSLREGMGPAHRKTPALNYDVPHSDFDYFMFEDRWRGTVADITHRQAAYVDLFRGRKNVLDLGCGRGEFVQLLSENGIGVKGIDGNADMVRYCAEKGLPVSQADIYRYLYEVPDRSLDAVTAFQVIEHLAPESLVDLLKLCARKLLPDGIFLAETINPNCPLSLSNFFLDPTHVRPCPAATLAFMCHQHGLEMQFIRYSAPVAGSEVAAFLEISTEAFTDVSDYQDYALIAKTPDSTAIAEGGIEQMPQ